MNSREFRRLLLPVVLLILSLAAGLPSTAASTPVAKPNVLLIVVGAGAFGVAVGCWRDPLQSLYAGIK